MRSNYIRRDEALDDLWQNSVSSGINFAKYNDIKVVVKGENQPKPIESFVDGGFAPLLKSNIQRAKYNCPTPVQKYAISIIKDRRDLMACAQTGSGKTAAFLFPMLDRLMREPPGQELPRDPQGHSTGGDHGPHQGARHPDLRRGQEVLWWIRHPRGQRVRRN